MVNLFRKVETRPTITCFIMYYLFLFQITSFSLYKNFEMMAVCGPTHDDQPPFSWNTADFADTTPHEGHPDTFDFEPITTNW